MLQLPRILDEILEKVWPARRHQELLLDLGERKDWDEETRRQAIHQLAVWLQDELCLPAMISDLPSDPLPPEPSLSNTTGEGAPGIGLRRTVLARLVGTSPKTLANSLSQGLHCDRRDHRWLMLLSRLEKINLDAVIFHRRSPISVANRLAMARLFPDAADAGLLLSLVALWQRRRPSARALRGRPSSRRDMPKPVAALLGELISFGQLDPLLNLACTLPEPSGATLAALVFDAALTEAHIVPHRPRRTDEPRPTGENWLSKLDSWLLHSSLSARLPDARLFGWRIQRMRAWNQKSVAPPPSCELLEHPHVNLATAISAALQNNPPPTKFSPDSKGHFMLLPQARRLGLVDQP